MNNEPVAWMGIRRHGEIRVSVEKLDKDDIPLYIHPVKDLTDSEIEQVWSEVTCQELNVPYSFARAILRKASEK